MLSRSKTHRILSQIASALLFSSLPFIHSVSPDSCQRHLTESLNSKVFPAKSLDELSPSSPSPTHFSVHTLAASCWFLSRNAQPQLFLGKPKHCQAPGKPNEQGKTKAGREEKWAKLVLIAQGICVQLTLGVETCGKSREHKEFS